MGYDRGREKQRRRGGGEEFGGGYQEQAEPWGGSRERTPRAPLVWQAEKSFTRNRLSLVLQSANLDNGGVRRSFRIGKTSQEQPDKPFPFIDSRDIGDVMELLQDLEAYLANTGNGN